MVKSLREGFRWGKRGIREQTVENLGREDNSSILRKIYEHPGQTINEKGIDVDALSRFAISLQLFIYKGFPPLKSLYSASPVEETDQFGFQHPPSLARLGGLDTATTDVFKEGGLGNPQVLTGFLGR